MAQIVKQFKVSAHLASQQSKAHGGVLMVVLLIIAAVVVVIVGILAAIAIPAYNEYSNRAKVVQAYASLSALKAAYLDFQDANSRLPTNLDDLKVKPNSPYVQSVTIDKGGIVTANLTGAPAFNGQTLTLSPGKNAEGKFALVCSGSLNTKLRPLGCRE